MPLWSPLPALPKAPDDPLALTMAVTGSHAFAFVVPPRAALQQWDQAFQRLAEVHRVAPDVQAISLGAGQNEIRLSGLPRWWWREVGRGGGGGVPLPPVDVIRAIEAVEAAAGGECGATAFLPALQRDQVRVPSRSECLVRGTPGITPWAEFLLEIDGGEVVAHSVAHGQVLQGLVRFAAAEAHPAALARLLAADATVAGREFCRTPLPRFAAWTPDDLAPWCTHAAPEVRAHAVLVAGAIQHPQPTPPRPSSHPSSHPSSPAASRSPRS